MDRLVAALRRCNPGLSDARLHAALRELSGAGAEPSADAALPGGQRVYTLLTRGLAEARGESGGKLARGRRPHPIRYLDWDSPAANDFVVTWQLPVRGVRRQLVFDLVVFVNGIPLAVLACPQEAPGPGQAWQRAALYRLWRAQEAEPADREQGTPRLFASVQLIAAVADQSALYGAVGTPPQRFARWGVAWPRTIGQVASLQGREPTPQDLLLQGMLAPLNFLDLLQHFVAFEPEPIGRGERLLCSGREFESVQSAYQLARSESVRGPYPLGGVLWHAGSESARRQHLLIAWLLRKLQNDPSTTARQVLLVVAESDSGRALSQALRAAGLPEPERPSSFDFPPPQAAEIRAPRTRGKRLPPTQGEGAGPSAAKRPGSARRSAPRSPEIAGLPALVLVTAEELLALLGRWQESLDTARPIVLFAQVLQTAVRELPALVRKALPGACLLGFTSTPPGPDDAAVMTALGPVLATYSFADAIAEGTALPVYLEERCPELHVAPPDLLEPRRARALQEPHPIPDGFALRTAHESTARRELEELGDWSGWREGDGTEADRVRFVCQDLSRHFRRVVRPWGAQAQLIARSPQAARLYKETFDRIGSLRTALLDVPAAEPLAEAALSDRPSATAAPAGRSAERLELLIGCLQCEFVAATGTLQAIYIDAPLIGQALLQAVLAVNTPAPGRLFGLLVDYAGTASRPAALAMFPSPLVFDALRRPEEELPDLQQALKDALRLVSGAQNLYSIEQCLCQFSRPEARAALDAVLQRCVRPLELLHDDPRARGLLPEFCWIAQVLLAAVARYRDDRIFGIACGPRGRRLLAAAIAKDGSELLVTRSELLSPLLDDKLAALEDTQARISELTQAIAYAIREYGDEDPALFAALRSDLERLLTQSKAQALPLDRLWQSLTGLRKTLVHRLGRQLPSSLSVLARVLAELLLADAAPAAAETAQTYGPEAGSGLRALAVHLDAQLAPLLPAAQVSVTAAAALRDRLVRLLLDAGYSGARAQAIAARACARLELPGG